MIEASYISCVCNQIPQAADWGRNNLICYATNQAISIFDPKLGNFGSVLSTLHAHNDKVNFVKWIKPNFPKHEEEFISASVDGVTIIWKGTNMRKGYFKATKIIKSYEALTLCDAIYLDFNLLKSLICTTSVQGNLNLWLRNSDNVDHLKTVDFTNKLPTALRVAELLIKDQFLKILLFIALEDSTIQLYHIINEKNSCDIIKLKSLVGHQDWVTCIDYILVESQNLLIASGSQDNTIHLWKISFLPELSYKLHDDKFIERKSKFLLNHFEYEIVLESIMTGHEAWIYGIQWHPYIKKNGEYFQPMKLLSCSLDKTAIIWEPSQNTGMWTEVARVGEVGGNSLGLYGCKYDPSGKHILTYGYHGSILIWEYDKLSQNWKPAMTINGHYDGAVDLSWDPKGRFMLTASLDQTTRAHAPWLDNRIDSWHEIGRPQVHGYSLSCITTVGSHLFASGATEKVARIFESPIIFQRHFDKNIFHNFNDKMAENISVSSLSLTNKEIGSYSKITCNLNLGMPLFEEELIRFTLWPELQKLYGHSYEIFSIASQHTGSLLATSSKASSVKHAAVILWDMKTWHQKEKLFFHELTVTQLAFSPNDKYLLCVSRDRNWSLYILNGEKYNLLSSSKKNTFHRRVIWSCAWTHDSKFFATGSRDGKIGVWSTNISQNETIAPTAELSLKYLSVTALAFNSYKCTDQDFYILSMGYENGCIDIKKVYLKNSKLSDWEQLFFLNTSEAHHSCVKRLAFRPILEKKSNTTHLASCGLDNIVKIYKILLE